MFPDFVIKDASRKQTEKVSPFHEQTSKIGMIFD